MRNLRVDEKSGWLEGVRRLVSPNQDARPPGAEIDLLVVHSISLPAGQYGGPWIDQLFTNCLDAKQHSYFQTVVELRVSAHALVRRDGEIVQYVPFHKRAWHAGASRFGGRSACNDFSIGIELEGSDHDPYDDSQYEVLAELSRVLMKQWPGIDAERIVGHCDIASGRKTDPGELFDWNHFRALLLK